MTSLDWLAATCGFGAAIAAAAGFIIALVKTPKRRSRSKRGLKKDYNAIRRLNENF